MKARYILILLSFFCVSMGFAQNKLFDRFAEMDDVSSVYISKAMFQMMPNAVKTGGLNLMNLKGKAQSLQLISTENKSKAEMMRKEFSGMVSKQHEELMRVKDGKTNATFYAKQNKETISELIMLANTEKGFTVIQLLGEFTLKDIQEITSEMGK